MILNFNLRNCYHLIENKKNEVVDFVFKKRRDDIYQFCLMDEH